MPDVFLSYRRADKDKAQALAKALRVEGLDVWWDADLDTGETFDAKVQKLLHEDAKAVIVLWSATSVKSEWVRAEASVGRERGILVPVMVRRCVVPVPYNVLQTADLTNWSGDRAHPVYRNVVKQTKELAGKTHVKPLKPPPNPALRSLWRALAAVAVLAAIGASTWVLKPWTWEAFNPEARAEAERQAVIDARNASRSKIAPFGVELADFDALTGQEIAQRSFNSETFDELKTMADAGEPAAQAVLCAVLTWGARGRDMNIEEAEPACTKAAESSDPIGHVYFGDYLTQAALYDPRVDADNAAIAATAEYRKAADLGVAWGELRYGERLRAGEGIEADPAGSEAYLKSARDKGLAGADYQLGLLYLSEKVAGASIDEAVAMIRKAADAGHAPAQFDLCERLVGGYDYTEDLDAALSYCKSAATAADPSISTRAERLVPDVERRIAERDAPTPP